MITSPLGLTERDFDAYHPDRASSNAYSRPRLEFRQRAYAWARGVTERLSELDIRVEVQASDEHPSVWNAHRVDCQWLFFTRADAARHEVEDLLDSRRGIVQTLRDPSPYLRHAFLALRIDFEHVQVCVQVHPDAWLDFETLQAHLASEESAVLLCASIAQLPEQFCFGLAGQQLHPCSTVTVEALRETIAEANAQGAAVWIGWSIPRDIAMEHSELLDDQLQDALVALSGMYQAIAWTPDNDPAGLDSKLTQMMDEKARAAANHAAELQLRREQSQREREELNVRSRERTREKVEYEAARPRVSLGNLFKEKAPSAGHPAPARSQTSITREPPRKAAPTLALKPVASEPRPVAAERRPPASAPPRLDPQAPEALDKGTRVRVLAGPFAGKTGVIGDLDGKGGARVLLGLLSTRLSVEDLMAEVDGKQRPQLQSSHRGQRSLK